jgi:hypothetical protein
MAVVDSPGPFRVINAEPTLLASDYSIDELAAGKETVRRTREGTMKAAPIRTLCGVVLTFALSAVFAPSDAQQTEPPQFFNKDLARHMLERRAVDAVIWGMPAVSLDALRQAYFRDVWGCARTRRL